MKYAKKKYSLFNYNITEKTLPSKYLGKTIISYTENIIPENSSVENPEFIPAVIDDKKFNPIFSYDKNAVHTGVGDYSSYINSYGLELLYDVEFGYDGPEFEIIYHSPREFALMVDEGDGWKTVCDRYILPRNDGGYLSVKISFFDDDAVKVPSYKMRRFKLRTTGWFGGIIKNRVCSLVKTVNLSAPLAVFEGTSITESCNLISGFNAFSYSRILSDIYGFQYLCLAQGGTGMAKPLNDRPCMLDRIDQVIKAEPDILFAEVGINDQPTDTFRKYTDEFLKIIRKKLPKTFIVMIGRYHPKFIKNDDFERAEIDVITGEVCKKYGVPFIELTTGYVYGIDGEIIAEMGAPMVYGDGAVFEPNGSGTADRYTGDEVTKDGCHCNPTAYKMYAQYIRSAFNSIINSIK